MIWNERSADWRLRGSGSDFKLMADLFNSSSLTVQHCP
jgi:hypothetical protein